MSQHGQSYSPLATVRYDQLQPGDVITYDNRRVQVTSRTEYSPGAVQVDFIEPGRDRSGRFWPSRSAYVVVLAGPTFELHSAADDGRREHAARAAAAAQPSKPRRWHRRVLTGLAVAGALLLGVGLGAGTQPTAQPKPPSNGGAEPKAVTETEYVTEVPQSCLDGLDAAERLVHESVVPFAEIVVELLDAASMFDVAGIETAGTEIEALIPVTDEIVADYNSASSKCRTAAQQ